MNLVTRTKINKDNVWIKAIDTETKSEVKFFYGVKSVRLTTKTTPETKATMAKFAEMINADFAENQHLAPQDIIAGMEKKLKKMFATV